MKVVVVESPAKAKTINKYLGDDFYVVASYGHIRDLPPKDGSVKPDDGFAMEWETDGKSERQIRDIANAVKKADRLYLATDPDREGEAISWHVRQVLQDRGVLRGTEVKRVVFNEITKNAVLEAMRNPRDIHQDLVDAYLARRALDYLVGFTLSPVLWRKLPGSRSAGRVQSVALRLICQRETEIEDFKTREYWSIAGDFLTPGGAMISAGLTRLDGEKLDKFALGSEDAAMQAKARIEAADFQVGQVERKKAKRNPYAPFTTSTLQQEASRKLHLSASRTMQLAQRLYEGVDIGGETVGLITYMRTDGVQMAAEAIAASRDLIQKDFGRDYVPSSPRLYKTKAKNAQEAHECIRPTDLFRRPDQVAAYLDRDQLRLYELIWKRTVASQMASAELDQVAVDVVSADRAITMRATGSVVVFDGFLKVYKEDRDDTPQQGEEDDSERLLPDVREGDVMLRRAVRPEQHFTQPPPRYSEASLVKQMEELGIGRPSTYASILSVLQDRNYVRLDQRRFIPEDRGRLVTAFLESFFGRYVEYNFTADLENQLDDVSGGRIDWKKVLEAFWREFSASVEDTKELRISNVIETLDAQLGPHFFPDDGSGHDPRSCPGCKAGRLSLKLGKFGAFIGCSNYPECRFTRPLALTHDADGQADAAALEGPKELGDDPETGELISLRKGPYGWYVQRGEGTKPKRVSLFKGLEPATLDYDTALKLLALPRKIGDHPESGKSISAGVGRFGPYLLHDGTYKSIPAGDDILTIGMNRAMELLSQARAKGQGAAPLRSLGEHKGNAVTVHSGRYGPYVSCDGIHATLPKGQEVDEITLEQAIQLIDAKAAKSPAKKKAAPKKAAAKKTAAKDDAESPAEKPTRKKAGSDAAASKPKKASRAKASTAKASAADVTDATAETKPKKAAAPRKTASKKKTATEE